MTMLTDPPLELPIRDLRKGQACVTSLTRRGLVVVDQGEGSVVVRVVETGEVGRVAPGTIVEVVG